ncbi:hypothetical protein HHK36_026537 [Tetracentron sinense]|uniref:Uncharacterized protein n=1 Tax=Tetracentron sinense TaxID=13715 RepID=A0A834YH05_TETSI|nr:hypothetical protein HHK36_026537 [Tetracentron sinense]
MGLLDKLWDDTFAGPRPDYGLGKLRKYPTFALRSNSDKVGEADGGNGRSYGEDSSEEATRITRSIMIVKPPGYQAPANDSLPVSPAGSTPPVSPFFGGGGGRDSNMFRRRSMSDVYERARGAGPRRSSSPYD